METVSIIGVGRMGSLLAHKISYDYNLILIDKDLRKCGLLAQEIGALATGEYSMLKLSDYIITALPASIIPNVLEDIKPYLSENQILINISTDTEKDTFKPIQGLCKLASAKIIGHALNIATTGELPLVLIDADDENVRQKTAEIFAHLGCTCYGSEKTVKLINNIASEEGIKAALTIEACLKELNIPPEYISFAIRNVACGTMNAYALGEAGPFVQKIIEKLK